MFHPWCLVRYSIEDGVAMTPVTDFFQWCQDRHPLLTIQPRRSHRPPSRWVAQIVVHASDASITKIHNHHECWKASQEVHEGRQIQLEQSEAHLYLPFSEVRNIAQFAEALIRRQAIHNKSHILKLTPQLNDAMIITPHHQGSHPSIPRLHIPIWRTRAGEKRSRSYSWSFPRRWQALPPSQYCQITILPHERVSDWLWDNRVHKIMRK